MYKDLDLMQIVFLVLTVVIVGFIIALLCRHHYRKKLVNLKHSMDITLSLNISHLHDAANFFSLIKQGLTKDSIRQEDILNTKNFSKGAAYHFRSIFEELKDAKLKFDQVTFSKGLEEKLKLFYEKDKVNLKDLIELELFQISDIARLKLLDLRDITSQPAWVKGNFSLLSKVLINLVENALKYSGQEVRVELFDKDNLYGIKITSYGCGIPEPILVNLENNQVQSTGHGLESLKDIVDYHDAELEVSSFDDYGASISIKFGRYEVIRDKQVASKALPEKFISRNNKKVIPSLLTLLLVLVVSFGCRELSLTSARNYTSSIINTISVNKPKGVSNNKKSLGELNSLWQEGKPEKFIVKQEKFLDLFHENDKRLISLLIFKDNVKYNSIYMNDYALEQAQVLRKEKLFDSYLNYRIAYLYSKKGNYLKSAFYSFIGFTSLMKEFFFVDTHKYLINKLEEKSKVLHFISYKAKVLPVHNIIKSKKKEIANQPRTKQVEDIISRQDKALGLEFDL